MTASRNSDRIELSATTEKELSQTVEPLYAISISTELNDTL
jgi:hypothetical protein